jgi:hypothetical protein
MTGLPNPLGDQLQNAGGPQLTPGKLSPMKPTTPQRGLGRVYQPNPGSRNYPISAALPRRAISNLKSKRWQMGTPHHHQAQLKFMDQSAPDRDLTSESTCVRYGLMHLLMLEPIVRPDAYTLTHNLYPWAQDNDFWPGAEPTYYGTSCDAGLQFLLHQIGVISEYRWMGTIDELILRLCLSAKEGGGPAGTGTDFYYGMSAPNGDGWWSPDGDYWGGHCWDVVGYQRATAKKSDYFHTGNSHLGNFEGKIEASALEWLLFQQNGECFAITETPR